MRICSPSRRTLLRHPCPRVGSVFRQSATCMRSWDLCPVYFKATHKLTSNFDELVGRAVFLIEGQPHNKNLHRDVNAPDVIRNSQQQLALTQSPGWSIL